MTNEKLTAAIITQHFNDRYAAIAGKLEDYELSKAAFLVEVGRECLALLRQVLEPFPDHIITGRKAALSKAMRQIEQQLPTVEGIGVPQLSRWVRWAGLAELIGDLTGLRQAHLMVLETVAKQHQLTATFRLKEPWRAKPESICDIVAAAVQNKSTGTELARAMRPCGAQVPQAIADGPVDEDTASQTQTATADLDDDSDEFRVGEKLIVTAIGLEDAEGDDEVAQYIQVKRVDGRLSELVVSGRYMPSSEPEMAAC